MATTPILGQLGGTTGATSTLQQVGAGALGGALPTNTTGAATQSPTTAAQNNVYTPPTAIGAVPTDGGSVIGSNGVSVQPATGSVPTSPSTIQNNGINWANGSNTVTGDFSDTYGNGTGQAITNVLSSMGTTNNAAIQATINQTDTAAQQQMGNIQAQEAAGGVTPNSSTAALASSNFYNQVNEGLQSTIGNMENSQQTQLLGALTTEGAAHGGDPTLMDSIMGGIGDATTIAGDATSLMGML